MSFKYSCADFTFPLLPHKNALKLIQLMGFDGVDLGFFEGRSHIYPSRVAGDPQKEAKELRDVLDDLQLAPADVFLQTGPQPTVAATNNPKKYIRDNNRDVFLKMIELTLAIGGKHITGLPGVFHDGIERKSDWEIATEETNWRVEMAKKSEIIYSVEPHLGSITPNPETIMEFINSCPGLTITLDYGHFIYQGLPMESVHHLIKFASHFHARGGAKEKLQTLVRENKIDYEPIVSGLKEANYSGFICMEYVYDDWGGCNRTDNVSETILLKQLFEQLEKG